MEFFNVLIPARWAIIVGDAPIVDGFCSKPCKMGKLQKEKAILEKKIKEAKE